TATFSVEFRNGAGMTTCDSIQVRLQAAKKASDEPPPTTGSIVGTVVILLNGTETEVPGHEVRLHDKDGAFLTSTKTNEKGVFEFADLKPGKYQVYTERGGKNVKDQKA